jgi:hypothetical protein
VTGKAAYLLERPTQLANTGRLPVLERHRIHTVTCLTVANEQNCSILQWCSNLLEPLALARAVPHTLYRPNTVCRVVAVDTTAFLVGKATVVAVVQEPVLHLQDPGLSINK